MHLYYEFAEFLLNGKQGEKPPRSILNNTFARYEFQEAGSRRQ